MQPENVAATGILPHIRGSGIHMSDSTGTDEVVCGEYNTIEHNTDVRDCAKSTTGRFIVMQHRTVNNLRLQLQHTETQRDMAIIERDYYCRELVALQSMYDNMKITHMSETNDLESQLKRADNNQDALQLLCVDFKRECATFKAERDEAVSEFESTEDS